MINKLITFDTRKLDFVEEQMHLNIHFFPIPFLNETNLTWSCAKITTEVWLTNPKSYLQNP